MVLTIVLAMVAEGVGKTAAVDWCHVNMLKTVARLAGDDLFAVADGGARRSTSDQLARARAAG